ncbi:hypothetical protein HBI18_161190 [Parastagonospora nodorum]|nr:hypothetical protein HBI18_161190 [Parastagonospora nodorum]
MHASLRKELEARHSLLNLSVYDLSVYAVFEYLASSSNLSTTIRYRASSLIYTNADKYSKKHLKVCEADALKQVDANVREEENKNYSSLYYSNKVRIRSAAQESKRRRKERLKALLNAKIRDSLSARVETAIEHYTLEEIFASIIGITRTRNKVVAIDPANSILCDLSNLLVVRFYIFSNSALENIGILINKKIIAEANMPAVHSKATKHYLALLAAQFALVCSFRKGQTIFNKFYNCKLEGTIIAKFYKNL